MLEVKEFQNGGSSPGVRGPTPMAPMPQALKDLLNKKEA